MVKKIHLVGIGGSGMSAIAQVLLSLGYEITGSDIEENENVKKLRKQGARVYIGHSLKNLEKDVDLVVYSSAIDTEKNPEIEEAKRRGIEVFCRIDMVVELSHLRQTIAIAGSHGKTTTTAMIGKLLKDANLRPTILLGGKYKDKVNLWDGKSSYLVVETDESDGSFLRLWPSIAVVTNIDNEHLDYYKDFSNLKSCFLKFAEKVPILSGNVVYCGDSKELSELFRNLKRRKISYGFSDDVEIKAKILRLNERGSEFDVYYQDKYLGRFRLKILGRHNILNALAVIGVGLCLDFDISLIKESISKFSGVKRRLDLIGQVNGIKIIDDYAHHPTEIKATLEAIKLLSPKRIIVIFQPHRYTRTYLLYKEFARAFGLADKVILAPIYSASERPIEGVSSKLILDGLKENGHRDAILVEEFDKIIEILKKQVKDGDIVVSLGAGDIWKVSERFYKILRGSCAPLPRF